MSLVEDVLQLLRYVLEYFGVPQEVLVPVWDSTSCGQYRSIVRMIGTNLPLAPYPRLHFQIPLQTVRRHGHIKVSVETPAVPSLADVLWLDEDEADGYTKFRNSVPLRKAGWSQRFEGPVTVPVRTVPVAPGPNAQPEALKKIHALEEELLKLRAQIALIVTAPTAQSPVLPDPITPCFSPLPAPMLTSTPLMVPPPPPPPLPPAVPGPVQVSVSDVIRQRQAERRGRVRSSDGSGTGGSDSSAPSLPSMLDVLKDLNQVKLRSVQRSPGGTPMRKRRSRGTASVSDPAALIAEALKRKFAHRRENSFDKENRSAEPSPFSSPDTPRIAHLTRRSQGRNRL